MSQTTPISSILGKGLSYQNGKIVTPAAAIQNAPSGVVTASGLSSTLSPLSLPAFSALSGISGKQIRVDSSETYQTFVGVGAALTDSAAYCFMNYLNATQRKAILTEMFGTNGFGTIRICLGSSDFSSVTAYSYDDTSNDTNLTNFSVARDATYLIPLMQQILAINPNLKILACPWSPPGWLKSSGSLNGGSFTVSAANMTTYANYLVKAIQAYATYGVNIWSISPQNEPAHNTAYPSCQWAASDLATFVGTYLGPALDAAGLTTKIMVGEDNWSQADAYVAAVAANSAALNYMYGSSWHGYAANAFNQTTAMRGINGKTVHFTEYRSLLSQTLANDQAQMAADVCIGAFRNAASSITLWNLALDQNGNPVNSSTGRRGVITIQNDGSGTITRNPEFYMLTHIGKYVKPGAVRCYSNTYANYSTGTDVESVAFKNPDGSIVLFLYNAATVSQQVTITDTQTGLSSITTMAAGDMQTISWGSAIAGSATVSAPSVVTGLSQSVTSSSVALAWTAPTSGTGQVAGYVIGRGSASGAETGLITLPASATGYTDSSVSASTQYFYTVTPFGAGGNGPSAEISATTSATSQTQSALAIDATSSQSSGGNSASYNFTHTVGSGANLLVIALASGVPSASSTDYAGQNSITANGTAMTKLDSLAGAGNPGTDRQVELWYLLNPTAGANTIAIATPQGSGASTPSSYAAGISFKNALTSGTFGARQKASVATSAGGTSLNVSSTATPGINIVIGAVRSSAALTASGTPAETSIVNGISGTNTAVSVATQAGSSSATASISWTTADQGALMLVPVVSAV